MNFSLFATARRPHLVLLMMAVLFITGCGSSGFTPGAVAPNAGSDAGTARQVSVTVSAAGAGSAQQVRFATVITSSLRVRLQSSDGTDVVAPLTVAAPAPGGSVTVVFNTVPLSATRLVVEQMDENGQVIVTQSSAIVIDAQSPNDINILLDGPVVTLVVAPATANLAPKSTLVLRAIGGSGVGYAWTLSTDGSGGSVSASGLYIAGVAANTSDTVMVTDSLGNTAEMNVNVGPLVSISPASGNVVTGASLSLQANGGSGTGFVWTLSTNASGAVITPSGLYTAGASANSTDVVTVTDSVGNTATAAINVAPLVTISPATGNVVPTGTLALTARGGSNSGFTWTLSSNSSGGNVRESGLYTAGPIGNTVDVVTVTDSWGNSATATINVGSVPSAGPLPLVIAPVGTVAPRGSQGLTASGGSGQGYFWTLSTNASGGSVTGSGLYFAGSKPNTTDVVTVTDGAGNTATAEITVGAGVTVTPPTATVTPKERLTLTAAGGSGSGFVFTLTTDGSGASVTTAGLYTAGAAGSSSDVVTVTDSLGNTAAVMINVGPAISITPSAPTVVRGESVAFSAVGGSGTGYTWAISTNGSGGTIDANTGGYKAGTQGGTTDVVTVTDSLLNTTTAAVTVGPAPTLASLTPSSGDAAGGSTVTLAGTHFDQVALVRIDGASVAFTRVSSTQLQITAPADPGTGFVSVSLDSDPGLSYGYDRTIPAGAHALDTTDGLFNGAPIAGLVNGTWNVGSFTLDGGATITVTGNQALVINSSNNVLIGGSIVAAGGDGGNGTTAPGAGGVAGPGGFAGGRGGTVPPDSGSPGLGPGAGAGGNVSGPSGTTVSSGGGGAGHRLAAAQVVGGAAAGPAYGAANDVPNVLVGGSGGGGGGRSPNHGSHGGGGGGGGGVIRIIARNTLVLAATATLDVHGGIGGNGSNFGNLTSGASGGGGGSGGSVWLSAGVTPTVDAAAIIRLLGGAGGLAHVGQPAIFSATDGGAGADGTLATQP